MSKTEHNHPFLDDVIKTLNDLNIYVNNKLSVSLYSIREKDITSITFEIRETGRFREEVLLESRCIYGYNYKLSNIEIDQASINLLDIVIDRRMINDKIKPDFIRFAVTILSSLGDDSKTIGWSMGYNIKKKIDE